MNTTWKERKQHRIEFESAAARAYQTFARLYPQWAAYNFDEHFLTHEGAHLLARYRDEGAAPEPHNLASAWARQMTWYDPGTRHLRIAELEPAAAHFLCLLEAELPPVERRRAEPRALAVDCSRMTEAYRGV